VENAMGAAWSAGLEYLHVSLSGPSATVGTLAAGASADPDIGRLKLNYRF
jgi:hypothetical protein